MTFLKRILLIEAETRATAIVRTALEETGRYLIKEEHDTRCAVSAARWFQPNLILCELLSAGAQAAFIADKLRQDSTCSETPVLFFSANPTDHCVVTGGVLSGYTFFADPLRLEEFVRYVAELLIPAK